MYAHIHFNKTETECLTEVQRHMGSKINNSQYYCHAVYAENAINVACAACAAYAAYAACAAHAAFGV